MLRFVAKLVGPLSLVEYNHLRAGFSDFQENLMIVGTNMYDRILYLFRLYRTISGTYSDSTTEYVENVVSRRKIAR